MNVRFLNEAMINDNKSLPKIMLELGVNKYAWIYTIRDAEEREKHPYFVKKWYTKYPNSFRLTDEKHGEWFLTDKQFCFSYSRFLDPKKDPTIYMDIVLWELDDKGKVGKFLYTLQDMVSVNDPEDILKKSAATVHAMMKKLARMSDEARLEYFKKHYYIAY